MKTKCYCLNIRLYIVNDKKSDGYSVYVGETTDIVRRTNQHLGEIREDWAKFSKSNTTKMFVIGYHHFNKSLTLDIENRLMLYLLSVDNVSNVQNRRGILKINIIFLMSLMRFLPKFGVR
ncbi:GIY-YIG nuclease family protein [Streptococcus sp. Marseille-Q5986]|uniref:GIY-YIG nuclease family protein n=1 Tax=Streptococcus sp. Marseille-Q5986 TaxID=2972782 RepID=UPI002B27B337|nr:GIY-YIG nuclease family protein [Streptococcus sp. Marseille-Q5986]